MSILKVNAKMMFTNETIKKKIKETHKAIRHVYHGLTLREILLAGHNWDRNKILAQKNTWSTDKKEKTAVYRYKNKNGNKVEAYGFEGLKEFFKVWNWDNTKEALVDFGLYDRPAVYHAKQKCAFLKMIETKPHLSKFLDLDKKISLEILTMFSLEAYDKTAVAYAIKTYLLSNYKDEELSDFWGILPMTKPIIHSLKLFDCEHFSQYDQTIFCQTIAQQCNVSSMYINTALWCMNY